MYSARRLEGTGYTQTMVETTTVPCPPVTAKEHDALLLEQQLLEGLRRGDAESYEQLVRTYSGHMLSVTRRMLRNEDDARDAVQDAFISAFRALSTFRADAKLSTWLYRIAMNAALMKLRSAGRRPEISIEPLLPTFDEEGKHAAPVESLSMSTEQALESQETRVPVRACIEQLPAQYRQVLMLRDINELDTAEVAMMLNITANAVKIRLHRAHQALMTLITKAQKHQAA